MGRLWNKLTGRQERGGQAASGSAEWIDLALDNAMRQLIDRGLVEVAPRRRDQLIEDMLRAALRARGLDSAIDLAVAAMIDSDASDEIWADDEKLRDILRDAFEAVARAAEDG
ncbi:MAG: hypothetical protein MJE77_13185 [Proteobacteria bacterium]|nr:hypothetical protein [Pseudomonadota bacterium]